MKEKVIKALESIDIITLFYLIKLVNEYEIINEDNLEYNMQDLINYVKKSG